MFESLLQNQIANLFILAFGFYALIKGADLLVSGAGSMARKWGIPSLVIGLTIVAFGTSAPELFVNVSSSLRGTSGITLGNIMGSNIANILLGIGIIAAISPIRIGKTTAWKEIPFLLLATFLMWSSASDHIIDAQEIPVISRSEGMMLLGFFILFIVYTFGISKNTDKKEGEVETFSSSKSILLFLIGVSALALGGHIVVSSASSIARSFNISESTIGITLVALGTSIPDIITTIIAARKKYIALAVGNIVGSNIFNILLVLGTSSVINPVSVEKSLQKDLLFTLGITALLFFSFQFRTFRKKENSHEISRFEGSIFIVLYVAYMIFLLTHQ